MPSLSRLKVPIVFLFALLLHIKPVFAGKMPIIKPQDIQKFVEIVNTPLPGDFKNGYIFKSISVNKTTVTYSFQKEEQICLITLGDESDIPDPVRSFSFIFIGLSCVPTLKAALDELLPEFLERMSANDSLEKLITELSFERLKNSPEASFSVIAKLPSHPISPVKKVIYYHPLIFILLLISFVIFNALKSKRTLIEFKQQTLFVKLFIPCIFGISLFIGNYFYSDQVSISGQSIFEIPDSVTVLVSPIIGCITLIQFYSIISSLSSSKETGLGAALMLAVYPFHMRMMHSEPFFILNLMFVFSAVGNYMEFKKSNRIIDLLISFSGALLFSYLVSGILLMPFVIAIYFALFIKKNIPLLNALLSLIYVVLYFAGIIIFICLNKAEPFFVFLSPFESAFINPLISYFIYIFLFLLGIFVMVEKRKYFLTLIALLLAAPFLLFKINSSNSISDILYDGALIMPQFVLICGLGIIKISDEWLISRTRKMIFFSMAAFAVLHYQYLVEVII